MTDATWAARKKVRMLHYASPLSSSGCLRLAAGIFYEPRQLGGFAEV